MIKRERERGFRKRGAFRKRVACFTNGLVLGGIPADARVIVAGQDLVAEGAHVNAVPADEAMLKKLVGDATGVN